MCTLQRQGLLARVAELAGDFGQFSPFQEEDWNLECECLFQCLCRPVSPISPEHHVLPDLHHGYLGVNVLLTKRVRH